MADSFFKSFFDHTFKGVPYSYEPPFKREHRETEAPAPASALSSRPKTIKELKDYCAGKGMPLAKMRFFVGENFTAPRAFGIYREGVEFVVYKNKADGSRAIHYRGRDEAYAVNELYLKLLDECHQRGIYPEGYQKTGSASRGRTSQRGKPTERIWVFIVTIVLFALLSSCVSGLAHRYDGYYSNDDERIYYRYGNNWYYSYKDGNVKVWYDTAGFPESNSSDFYLGKYYDADWGASNFKSSEMWQDIRERESSSSSDYDSWDSDDTDWDSEW